MTRKFVISATASLVIVWAVSAKAEGLQGIGFFQTSAASQGHFSQYPHSRAWPVTNHEPAIGKSLRVPQATALQSTPDADYQYEWQHQPAPPAPYLATPQQFSYPKQGFFPRDGKVEQAPGYEYDFGDTGSYPPMVPMEGASWVARRTASGGTTLHAPQPFIHSSGHETHIGCLHW